MSATRGQSGTTSHQQPATLLEQYDYTYTGLNLGYYRVETNAAARYDYTFDKLRRMTQEKKRGTGQGTPLHYQKDFSYDKAGNRASYQHQNGGGYNYGLAVSYNSYSYDPMGRLTQIRDTGRSFTATVTNDWNGNITQVSESWGGIPTVSTFAYDYENRLTEFTVGNAGFSAEHTYDGFNRLVKTDATVGQTTTNYEHVYAGKKHLGNIDVTSTPVNGKVWRWEGGAGAVDNAPIEAPQRSSASATQFYALNDEKNMQRKSYRVASVTAGDYNDDSRYAEWQQVNGSVVPCRVALTPNPSELFSAYAITLDADRASSAATNHALQLAATDLEYEVTRVKSPVLGRDLNPMGRGDGTYYCNGGNSSGGSIAVRGAKPSFTGNRSYGYGNDMNNGEDDSEGPNPNCFTPCICAPDCLQDWMDKGRKGYPTDCCTEEGIAGAAGCCMSEADRQDPVKVAAFAADCLGCDKDCPPEAYERAQEIYDQYAKSCLDVYKANLKLERVHHTWRKLRMEYRVARVLAEIALCFKLTAGIARVVCLCIVLYDACDTANYIKKMIYYHNLAMWRIEREYDDCLYHACLAYWAVLKGYNCPVPDNPCNAPEEIPPPKEPEYFKCDVITSGCFFLTVGQVLRLIHIFI